MACAHRSPSISGESTHIDFSATWWRNESATVAGQGIGFTPATAASPFNAPGLVNYVAGNQPSEASDADWAPEAVRGANIGTGLGFQGTAARRQSVHRPEAGGSTRICRKASGWYR
jgi:hypothetical protein